MTEQQKDRIIAQAREVRRLQKLYFRYHDGQVLKQSKKAELELDRMLAGEQPETGLFGGVKELSCGNGV